MAMKNVPHSKSEKRRMTTQRASSNPAKAESRANLKTTFGTPKKQK